MSQISAGSASAETTTSTRPSAFRVAEAHYAVPPRWSGREGDLDHALGKPPAVTVEESSLPALPRVIAVPPTSVSLYELHAIRSARLQ